MAGPHLDAVHPNNPVLLVLPRDSRAQRLRLLLKLLRGCRRAIVHLPGGFTMLLTRSDIVVKKKRNDYIMA
jgi:hypothetical protein